MGAQAQSKNVKYDEQLWNQFASRLRFAEKWSLHFDVGIRFRDGYIQEKTQYFVRPGIIYQASKKVQISGGYAFFSTSQWLNGYEDVFRPEHRYWNFITIRESFGRFEIRHRYRLEARWQQKFKSGKLLDGYDFFWRFGYQFQCNMALNNKKITDNTIFLIVSDELMVNAGKTIENYFDQNRIAAGLGYQFNDTWRLTATYQYVYGKQARGTQAISAQLIWLTLSMNLDLRKKENK
jgi:long-subunit fatty acid transport protein